MNLQKKSLEQLFVSKVRIKALEYFALNPGRPIHLRGAVRELKEEINAVRREMLRLEAMKFVSIEKQGNKKYFALNLEHPFLNEILSMFHKSSGLGGEIIQAEKKLGQIDFAFLSPAFTKASYFGDTPIDLLIVGLVEMSELGKIIQRTELKIGKEINYAVLKPNEFETRKRRKDPFIHDLFMQDIVMLIGKRTDMIKH